ncbi:MAG: dihydroorotate dehydrogenase electron transfer subunit [archaeon]
MEAPAITKIIQVVNENPGVKTFFLERKIHAMPGQFMMVWLPGIDEKPFSLSGIGKDTSITVLKRGRFTEEMFRLNPGDRIGIRGPYGKGFSESKDSCVVAGGVGIAPLLPMMKKTKPIVIFGAKTRDEIICRKELSRLNARIFTDDGSEGSHGFATNGLQEALNKNKVRMVYTCGPEIMMKKVLDICTENKVECEASLERYMKCGLGICGACAADGQRVCRDGPVFNSEQLQQIKDFGNSHLLKSGKNVPQ